MPGRLVKPGVRTRASRVGIVVVAGLSAGCAMAGFGGSLQLNITDQQTRQLTIRVSPGADDSRVIELNGSNEVEIGVGVVQIDRYVLQRATFGRNLASGFFLCTKPCTDPLSNYLLAYSPDQLFVADGQLDLRFRVVRSNGTTEEMSRAINAEMLPELWQDPNIQAGPSPNR